MKNDNREEVGKVGPGRPPIHTRFKPGQSGNPSGRKPGTKSFKTLIREALEVVRKGEIDPLRADEGVAKDMTVGELMVANWIVKALEGDWKAADRILEHLEGKPVQAVNLGGQNGENPVQTTAAVDKSVMREVIEELQREV